MGGERAYSSGEHKEKEPEPNEYHFLWILHQVVPTCKIWAKTVNQAEAGHLLMPCSISFSILASPVQSKVMHSKKTFSEIIQGKDTRNSPQHFLYYCVYNINSLAQPLLFLTLWLASLELPCQLTPGAVSGITCPELELSLARSKHYLALCSLGLGK